MNLTRGECPFLLSDGESGYVCSIYETRPRICRSFVCYTMLIFDRDNREVGKVKGRRSLESTDLHLVALWEEIQATGSRQRVRMEKRGSWVLERNGYRAEFFE